MLIPLLLPLFYCARYKRESLGEISTITGLMVLIVVLYWPLLTSNFFFTYTYIAVKILLFILLLLGAFLLIKRNTSPLQGKWYGISKDGLKKSCFFFVFFLPIMLIVTFIIKYINGISLDADVAAGTLSFFEAFTEEFFFRGILFLVLLKKTNLTIAYLTSLASFTLMHPQNLTNIFIIGTIVQGILTIEIARRSKNIVGSWFLHGSNRFFELTIIPFLL
jgi:membrane protease YdiL (CAAX protease family)